MNPCVVNVAVGGAYGQWQLDLVQTLRGTGYEGEILTWVDGYPPKSPSHADMPYAFKAYAMEEAIRRGHDVIVWADSSVSMRLPIQPILEEIEEEGYWLCTQGWNVGQWCTDKALEQFELTREEAWEIPMLAATFFGVNYRHNDGRALMNAYAAHARDGSFKGAWRTDADLATVATKPKQVFGHRHDQTALSVVAHKLGLKVYWPPCRFAYFAVPQDAIVIAVAGGK